MLRAKVYKDSDNWWNISFDYKGHEIICHTLFFSTHSEAIKALNELDNV